MKASSRMEKNPMSDERLMGQVIEIDEARIRDRRDGARETVEETLNEMRCLTPSMTSSGAWLT
jgi:hypothetical protein